MDRIKKSLSLIVWSFLILSQKNFAGAEEIDLTMTTKEESEQIETASKIIENPWLVDSTAVNQSIKQLKEIQSKYSSTTSKKTQLEEEKLETTQLEDVQSLIQKLNNIVKINNELLLNTAPTADYGVDIINLHENVTKIFTNIWQITSDVVETILKRIELAIRSDTPESKEKIANNKDAQEKLKGLYRLQDDLLKVTNKLAECVSFYEKLKKFDQENRLKDHPITIRLTSIQKNYDKMFNFISNKSKKEKEDLDKQHKKEIKNLTNEYEEKIKKLINEYENEGEETEEDLYEQNQKEANKIKALTQTIEDLKKSLQTEKNKSEKRKIELLNKNNTDTETIFEKNEKIEQLTNIMIGGAIVGGIVCVVAGYKIGHKIGALKNSPQLPQENRSLPDKNIIHTMLPATQQKKLQHVL